MEPLEPEYSVYFGGALFTYQELVGNALLARRINKRSRERARQDGGHSYRCVVPQDLEQADFRSFAIKRSDLISLLKSDLGLFNYNSAPVDDGTVVEAEFAHHLGIPSVLFRTDFRLAGDMKRDEGQGMPWNLMLGFNPRSVPLVIESMLHYQQFMHSAKRFTKGLSAYTDWTADQVIEALDRALLTARPTDPTPALARYRMACESAGCGMLDFIGGELEAIVSRKLALGLI